MILLFCTRSRIQQGLGWAMYDTSTTSNRDSHGRAVHRETNGPSGLDLCFLIAHHTSTHPSLLVFRVSASGTHKIKVSSHASAKLPPIFAVGAGDECRHRFICRSRLLLRVGGLLRLATTTFEHALDGSGLLKVRQRWYQEEER